MTVHHHATNRRAFRALLGGLALPLWATGTLAQTTTPPPAAAQDGLIVTGIRASIQSSPTPAPSATATSPRTPRPPV